MHLLRDLVSTPLSFLERAKILNERSEFSILGEGVNRGMNVGRSRSWTVSIPVIQNLFQNLIPERLKNKPSPQPSPIGDGVSMQAQSEVLNNNVTNHPLPQSLPQGREIERHISLKQKAAFTLTEGATHVAMPKNQCKAAFTLAEVLITLGIIGIVAALTMPTLMANYRKKVYATQLKRVVNVLSNNFKYILANENIDDLCNSSVVASCDPSGASFPSYPSLEFIYVVIDQEKYAKFFNLTGVSENTNFNRSLNDVYGMSINTKGYVLADGSFISLGHDSASGLIYTDVNGEKGPNVLGLDRYLLDFGPNGAIPYYNGFYSVFVNEAIKAGGYEIINSSCKNIVSSNKSSDAFSSLLCFYYIVKQGWEIKY